MNDFISTFSFYGVLRIIIPGLYVFIGFNRIFTIASMSYNVFENDTLNTIAVTILVIVLGLTIYSFDFPRIIRRFTSALPTNQIKAKFATISLEDIEKSYFRFYYSLEQDKKERTERYNGFYHLSINLFVVGLILVLIQGVLYFWKINDGKLFQFNILILLLCFFNSIMVYKKRLIKTYKGDLMLYWNSEEFKTFKKEHNLAN